MISRRVTPAVGIGSWIVTRTSPGRTISWPLLMTWRLPATLTGTTGSPASIATTNGPFLNRPTLPSTLLVPSGNTINECDAPTSRFIFSTMSAPGFLRLTSRWPVRCRCQPRNGNEPSDALATMRSCSGSDANRIGMS